MKKIKIGLSIIGILFLTACGQAQPISQATGFSVLDVVTTTPSPIQTATIIATITATATLFPTLPPLLLQRLTQSEARRQPSCCIARIQIMIQLNF